MRCGGCTSHTQWSVDQKPLWINRVVWNARFTPMPRCKLCAFRTMLSFWGSVPPVCVYVHRGTESVTASVRAHGYDQVLSHGVGRLGGLHGRVRECGGAQWPLGVAKCR